MNEGIKISRGWLGLMAAAVLLGYVGFAFAQASNCSPLMPVCFAGDTPALANDVNANFKRAADYSVPAGGIIMWSGTTVPTGWVLCNGTNGTPDLRGRFVVGNGVAPYLTTGTTGGSNSILLTTAQLPSHTHSITGDGSHSHSVYVDTGGGGFAGGNFFTAGWCTGCLANESQGTTGAGFHDHGGATGSAGTGTAVDARPPFYALAFIMKT